MNLQSWAPQRLSLCAEAFTASKCAASIHVFRNGAGTYVNYFGPGSTGRSSRAPKHQDLDLKAAVIKALAGDQSANELMPLMMMAMLADNKSKKSKRRKERETDTNLLGSSSSGESEDESHVANRGMKAVATLHRLHARIQKKPLKVCAIFEKEAREELGVVQGQSWTLRDFVKKQP